MEQQDNGGNQGQGTMSSAGSDVVTQTELVAGLLEQAFQVYILANPTATLAGGVSGVATFVLRHYQTILSIYRDNPNTFARWQLEMASILDQVKAQLAAVQPEAQNGVVQ